MKDIALAVALMGALLAITLGAAVADRFKAVTNAPFAQVEKQARSD
jgi:uncharacterized membrane protein